MHEQPAEEEEAEDSAGFGPPGGEARQVLEMDSALGMSSLDIPEKSVAQATKLPTDERGQRQHGFGAAEQPVAEDHRTPVDLSLRHQADEPLLLNIAWLPARQPAAVEREARAHRAAASASRKWCW